MAVQVALDECLSIRDGRLFIEELDADVLARQFGTPITVISEDQLRRNARRYRREFGARWPEGTVAVLASIKANFALATRWILSQEGIGCDVFGGGELYAALQGGVPPDLISVNGSIKSRALLETAVMAGARITLDSAAELDLVAQHRGACIAHCPTSNTLLGSGIMPLDRICQHGIEYAICTDVGASPTPGLPSIVPRSSTWCARSRAIGAAAPRSGFGFAPTSPP